MGARHDPHKYATLQQPTLIQGFDTLAGLTITKNAAATAEIRTDYKTEGTGSLYLDNTNGGTDVLAVDFVLPNGGIRFGPGVPVDMGFRVYQPSSWNGVSILCFLGNNASFSTFCSGNAQPTEGKRNQTTYLTGWSNCIIDRAMFNGGAHANLDTGGVLWTHMRIRLEAGRGPIYFDSLWLNARSRMKIVVGFDDAAASTLTSFAAFGNVPVWQYMKDRGIPGTVYVNAAELGNTGIMTIAQVKDLQDNKGWDVANHLFNHESIEFKTDDAIRIQYESNRDWQVANGIATAHEHVAYPTGSFNVDNHPALLKSFGAKTARTIGTGVGNYPNNIQETHCLVAFGVTTNMPASQMTDALMLALKQGRHFMSYWHQIATPAVGSSDWLPDSVKTVLDLIYDLKQQGIADPVTITEWYRQMFNPGR